MTKITQLSILSLAIFGLLLTSCSKISRTGIIERDCTGTYLDLNGKDYLICNPAMVNGYLDGASITVKFTKDKGCPAEPGVSVCELYHKTSGYIQIKEVK